MSLPAFPSCDGTCRFYIRPLGFDSPNCSATFCKPKDEWVLEHEKLYVCISREKLLKKKQGWLEASKEHPFQHCRVCTIEDINKLLGLDLDAEKEVEEYDEEKKKSLGLGK